MKKIVVNDKMQKGYVYELTEPTGKNFDTKFKPELTPKEMLSMGVFGGRYMRDCQQEFPKDWFGGVKLHPDGIPGHSNHLNYFGVGASLPLKEWQKRGWIHMDDPRGWFQWYCRYFMGRRHEDDSRQIKRWKAMRRHMVQIRKYCQLGDMNCRRRQRQALLHWAYDSRRI